MARIGMAVAFGLIAGVSPAFASVTQLGPSTGAPIAGPGAKYCMRIEPIIGSRIEEVKCWTRAEWAQKGVDVDRDWPKEGVRVIER